MSDVDKIAQQLHPLERKVVPHLSSVKSFKELVEKSGLKEVEAMRALQWLSNKKVIEVDEKERKLITLDKNGLRYLKEGLPEIRFIRVIKGTTPVDSIQKEAKLDPDEVNISIGLLRKKAAIEVLKEGGLKVKLLSFGEKLREKEPLEAALLKTLQKPRDVSELKPEEQHSLDELKKRRGIIKIDTVKTRSIKLTKLGQALTKVKLDEAVVERVTPDMLKSGAWQGKKFRSYDVKINVPQISGGKRHFENQVIEYAKKIWMDLGFQEMQGTFVHTSFWDLDALFVPQDHPARQMQDTFYLKNPSHGKLPPIFKKIKAVHENGGDTGSLGWQAPWDERVAQELLLRTHTTVLSAQTLARLKKEDLPAKFFSVGKVFRNEALDWKHLFEFYQTDGIVIDPNATFTDLIGYIKEFFKKMGYPDARIRPAHFPYTEPSAEVDVYHPEKKEWIELGGCGVFRPEVVKPLLGIDVPVLAWGLGLGRIMCPYFGINDLRDINRNDLKQLREMKVWMK